jgi:hypothetical protein
LVTQVVRQAHFFPTAAAFLRTSGLRTSISKT